MYMYVHLIFIQYTVVYKQGSFVYNNFVYLDRWEANVLVSATLSTSSELHVLCIWCHAIIAHNYMYNVHCISDCKHILCADIHVHVEWMKSIINILYHYAHREFQGELSSHHQKTKATGPYVCVHIYIYIQMLLSSYIHKRPTNLPAGLQPDDIYVHIHACTPAHVNWLAHSAHLPFPYDGSGSVE